MNRRALSARIGRILPLKRPASDRTGVDGGDQGTLSPAVRHTRAWLLLAGALALHVVDEAATGFLDFYNALVRDIRSQVPWFPMPTFTVGVWLTGLAALVVALVLLTPVVRRGGIPAQAMSWLLSGIMLLNGFGHLAGSIYFRRWLPGATSAPLLLVASVRLASAAKHRRRSIAESRRGARRAGS